ncbi:MAG: hypothetical protein C4297_11570 [Gemmataceae bacterium]
MSYYGRMRVRRPYALRIEMNEPTIRSWVPRIPGALTTPGAWTETPRQGNRLTFYVTPLVRGRLRGAALLVEKGGTTLEIPLRMKGYTYRLTWFFFILALVLPVVTYFVRLYPLEVMDRPPTEAAQQPGPGGAGAAAVPPGPPPPMPDRIPYYGAEALERWINKKSAHLVGIADTPDAVFLLLRELKPYLVDTYRFVLERRMFEVEVFLAGLTLTLLIMAIQGTRRRKLRVSL